MKLIPLSLTLAAPLLVSAKTVALWPIECNPATKAFDGSSAVADGDALTTHGDATISGVAGTGWMLPPNPDASALLYEPGNNTAICGALGEKTAANGMILTCTSANVVNRLYPLQDFTLEGWFKFTALTTDNWTIFLQQSEGSATGKGGWFVSALGLGTAGQCRFRLCAAIGSSNKEQDFGYLTAEEEASLATGWHHFALTFDYDDNGVSTWTCYLDGVSKGTVSHAKMSASSSLGKKQFFFGGRDASGTNRFNGSFDYWRLSDCVLTPDAFLNKGNAPTPHPVHTTSTVAYWKMDVRDDGSLDASDSVGTADLSDGFYDVTSISGFFPGIVPSAEQAFVGNPPNPNAALSAPNGGCFRSPNKTGSSDSAKNGTVLVVPDLGKELTYDNDFTVEGWLKPSWRTGAAQGGFLLGTRNSAEVGWTVRVTSAGELYLFANDGGSGDVRSDARIATLPSSWKNAWTHLALVYEAAVVNGTWSLYANGEKLGSLANARAASGAKCSGTFRLGGRENTDSNLAALYDCWRVSKAALAPEQFLCTKDGSAAKNVLAYWPLDVKDGIAWDLRDEMGSYTIRPVRSAAYRPAADDDAPVVTNPDTTASFDGCPSSNRGSFAFRAADGSRNRANLVTSDKALMDAVSATAGFTVEGYVKLTAEPTGTEYVFLTKTGAFSATDWSDHQIALLYGASGFSIVDKKFSNFGNGVSGSFDGGVMSVGVWHHVAVSYRGVESKNANNQTVLTSYWSLAVDGKPVKTISRATLGAVSSVNPSWFLLGARPSAADGLVGCLDSWRVSSKVLDPVEYLCAEGTRPAATPVVTRAYWPLDANGAAVDADSRVDPAGYTLARMSSALVTASLDQARERLPLSKTDLPRANAGSVVFSGEKGAYMRSVWLGRRLSLDQAFTVEGWIKWNTAVRGTVQQVAGTLHGGKGWGLLLDDTGDAPRFRVVAQSGSACTYSTDAPFASPIPAGKRGGWFHVALAYDPQTGRGTWSLRVDGKDFGSVANAWRNDALDGVSDTFYLGNYDSSTEALAGGYDMWRVSSGLVPTDDLLWQKPCGFTLLVR